MVTGRQRIAVLGGDGRHTVKVEGPARIRVYRSPRDGGNGDLRRLTDALKAGGVDQVVILARFNSHSATTPIRRLCRRLGVPVDTRS